MNVALLLAVGIVVLVMKQKNANATSSSSSSSSSSKGKAVYYPPPNLEQLLQDVANVKKEDADLLRAFCWQESDYNPAAVNNLNSNNPSCGLMQIRPVPWLSYFGFMSIDKARLFDARFNLLLGCDILNYFRGRGYIFPAQADVYNLGETAYNATTRNFNYRSNIQRAVATFKGGQ